MNMRIIGVIHAANYWMLKMTKEQADELIDMIEDYGYECLGNNSYNSSVKKLENIRAFINGLVNEYPHE